MYRIFVTDVRFLMEAAPDNLALYFNKMPGIIVSFSLFTAYDARNLIIFVFAVIHTMIKKVTIAFVCEHYNVSKIFQC